ncbi:MAG: hypothetical protein AB7E84_03085 [Xanthobacteraceae bacterium]
MIALAATARCGVVISILPSAMFCRFVFRAFKRIPPGRSPTKAALRRRGDPGE